MADKSVSHSSIDHFSLGANFEPQSGSAPTTKDFNEIRDENGDQALTDLSNETTRTSCTYHYKGSDLDTDLVAKVGQVVNSILIDKITVKTEAQKPVEVSIEGHNHTANAHAASAVEGDFDGFDLDLTNQVGTLGAFDVPSDKPWSDAGTDSDLVSQTLSFECEHNDAVGGSGDHHVGTSFHGIVTCEARYIGNPTLTTTGWDITSDEDADSNSDHIHAVVRGQKALSRTTVPA